MPMSAAYRALYQRSIDDPAGFWDEQARRIDWQTPYSAVLDDSRLPFARWFVGGRTNLCHNAIDRHLATRGEQPGLVYVSTETGIETTYTYRQLHREVNRMAATLQALGVKRGDRVLIYLPMIPEAAFAMLACARIGAIHSVVFGGFASNSLATRIDDATPRVIVSADAGSRAGKIVEYKPLLDAAIDMAAHKPERVLLVDRKLAPLQRHARDVDYASFSGRYADAEVPCEWMESSEPSYILYTSGTTGKPKGVQRDTGGYAVALAASIPLIFGAQAGDTMFTASDVGWVVGHSYIVYAPLLAGLTTVMYEGTPIRPDGAIWWRIVEQYRVNVMFTAPTAIRVLKKQDPALLQRHDVSSLRRLFLAGEPLDEPTASWIGQALDKPIVDNYWQTETGWPMLAIAQGVEPSTQKLGSPGFPVYGYKLDIVDEATGQPCAPGEKGLLAVAAPLPPGCMSTVWGDDARFLKTYWSAFPGQHIYSSFDWGVRDEDGYVTILGRTDDVINVAGHRLGTREIEESLSSHPAIAEVAVVGVADQLKGQVAMAFAIVRDASRVAEAADRLALEGELMRTVEAQLGAVARPARVFFVGALPKTRSGKLLRRAMQAVAEGRDPGDLTTIEDPTALAQVQAAMQSAEGANK
ncbi:propionate--CoA ligase [Ralstonia mannitolilytica]|uniref:Propionate--CoA ligase n=1 Tax=Ralstonia mannitolilytica TaxID=105219 RepID=A0AAJ4ZK52_9RALS|nr:propionate--CoA ligase [Ralstonia mannitolilytica]CAG2150107.1 Acetyl-coenzyme A synthetase [Ralstonia mannitolilytica]CAJ0724293.1 Acetyl-coenzyme A synthetase [Ralstonia mannitolilytica]SUD87391.1 Acetyl-coenzyme A synthetase [Ralstonia mannitolilytica]SUD93312.1 Acetyl-coenzyme A synthetase [Ralstonia mannitolilytica]SUD97051.1 Acetyl-coenzyme A synthetase [Ralstonia mannitolilytica]